MCHVTGTAWWDIPKGRQDPGESSLATVIRETREETGLELMPDALVDLGVVYYREDKSLHLFVGHVSRSKVEPARCVCTTYFQDGRTGALRPEMDGFAWVAFEDVPRLCAKAMARLLVARLPLATLGALLPVAQCLA